MSKRKSKKKQVLTKDPDKGHLKVAFALGKTVKKASRKIDKVKSSSKGRSTRKRSSLKNMVITRPDVFLDIPKGSMSPLLKELKGIMDVSGLTAAIQEMNEIGLRHSSHPVVNRLVTKV